MSYLLVNSTLEYLITVQHKRKLRFIWLRKKDNLMLFKAFSINLNAQNIIGMTHTNLILDVRLLDTLE